VETENLRIPLLILITGSVLLTAAHRLAVARAAVLASAILAGAGAAWCLGASLSAGTMLIGAVLLCGAIFIGPKMAANDGRGESATHAFGPMCGLLAAGLALGNALDVPTLYGSLVLMTVCLQVWMRRHAPREICDACLRYQAGCLLLIATALVWIYGATGQWSIAEITARGLAGANELGVTDRSGVLVAAGLFVAGLCGAVVLPVIPIGRQALLREGDITAAALVLILPAAGIGLALLNWLPAIATWSDSPITVLLLVQWLLVGGAAWLMFGRTRISVLLGGLIVLRVSFWLLAIAVKCWNAGHSGRGWASSGLASGDTAAVLCIVADVLALLGLVSALAGLGTDQEPEFLDDLAGLLRLNPLRGIVAAISLCSIIGIPPLPGFWAYWSLLTSVFSPQQFSTLTRLYAPHFGFLAGAVVAAGGFVILVRVCLAALQRIAMDPPRGRFPEHVRGVYVVLPAALLGLLLVASFRPAWIVGTPASQAAGQTAVSEDEPPRRLGSVDMRR